MKKIAIAMTLAVFLLPGCNDVKNVLSFPREGPNEFSVTTNRPLVIPPDFKLRPPPPADAAVAAPVAPVVNNEEAALLLEGGESDIAAAEKEIAAPGAAMSAGEAALLEQLGSEPLPPAGQSIEALKPEEEESEETVLDKIWKLF